MRTTFSMPAAGSSMLLFWEKVWLEFWSAQGNEAASARNNCTMYTTQGINIFFGQREVIGSLKAANTKDPDILHAVIAPADTQYKIISLFSWVITALGVFLCLTIIGAIIGIPMILASWLGRRIIRKQLRKIKATCELFCKESGVMLKAA